MSTIFGLICLMLLALGAIIIIIGTISMVAILLKYVLLPFIIIMILVKLVNKDKENSTKRKYKQNEKNWYN